MALPSLRDDTGPQARTRAEGGGAMSKTKQVSETQIAIGAMVVPLFFVVAFATCIIGSYHRPDPKDIKFAVVGPAAQTAQLRAGLGKVAGGAFDIRPVSSVAQATHGVRQRDLDAAYVPSAAPGQPASVIIASAGGRIVALAAETLARSAAGAERAPLVLRETRPLSAGDELGLGVFMFMIVCTICGYITPTALETLTPGLRPGRRYPIMAAVAVLVPVIAYLIGGLGYGVYQGSPGTIVAFIGVGALYVFVIAIGTRLFQVLLGPPAILASLAVLVFLNIASLGATYTTPVMAPFWRFLHHFWLGAKTVDAERDLLYFGGLSVGPALLGLLAWGTVIAALLVLPVSRRLERRRERAQLPGPVRQPAAQLAGQP
jgi:hypothetical protein